MFRQVYYIVQRRTNINVNIYQFIYIFKYRLKHASVVHAVRMNVLVVLVDEIHGIGLLVVDRHFLVEQLRLLQRVACKPYKILPV